MKRNAKWWFSSLIMLLVLVLSFSAAGEELTVSSKVNAELYAEKALEEKYGITPVMLDYFVRTVEKYSLHGTTQGRYLTGGVPPVRFSM